MLQIALYVPLHVQHAHLNFTVQLVKNHLQILNKVVYAKTINISILIIVMIVLQNVNNVQTLNGALNAIKVITVFILMVNAIVKMDIILLILIQFVINVQHIIVMFVIKLMEQNVILVNVVINQFKTIAFLFVVMEQKLQMNNVMMGIQQEEMDVLLVDMIAIIPVNFAIKESVQNVMMATF
ncbi:unnamed protein product [Paramecium primaurelia]|nr:unnamed protein product [Paramecium primaurelia]